MNSFSSFDLLPGTCQALTEMGIQTPTPIQERAIPSLLDGRDVVGQARTGSGKTLAFGIPLVEMLEPANPWVQALVLVPTRELAAQVAQVLEHLGRRDGLKVVRVVGGVSAGPQEQALRRGAQIVVGAPGRVLDLVRRGTLKLDRLVYMVLDEADEMLDRGFAPDVQRILSETPAPKDRQTAMFSATLPTWVQTVAGKHLHQPIQVAVDTRPEDRPQIDHVAWEVDSTRRMDALRDLLDHHNQGPAIVFGRTKHGVRKLGRQLSTLGYRVAVLQGNMSQNARDREMASFRSGQAPILVATNVAARGLDVDGVGIVVNFELPETAELLTHRVGRTGRMGREGRAVTLLTETDQERWRQFERDLAVRIPRRPWRGLPPSGGPIPGGTLQTQGPAPTRRPTQAGHPVPASPRSHRQAGTGSRTQTRSGSRTQTGSNSRQQTNPRGHRAAG